MQLYFLVEPLVLRPPSGECHNAPCLGKASLRLRIVEIVSLLIQSRTTLPAPRDSTQRSSEVE